MHFHTGSRRPHSERFEPLLTSEGGNIWMQEEEEEVIPSGQLACEVQSRGRVASRPCRTFSSEQVDSARALENSDRRKWAREWGRCALQVAEKSSWLQLVEGGREVSSENIIRTFLDRAPATLKKHLQGWHRWTSFCLLCLVLR